MKSKLPGGGVVWGDRSEIRDPGAIWRVWYWGRKKEKEGDSNAPARRIDLRTIGRYATLRRDISRCGLVTPEVSACMSVTQFDGVGQVASTKKQQDNGTRRMHH